MLPFVPRRAEQPGGVDGRPGRWRPARRGSGLQVPQGLVRVRAAERGVPRINQNDEISEKISLWNQQGSKVDLGHPVGDSHRRITDLRAAAVPARRTQDSHPGAQASDRGAIEDRDRHDARRSRRGWRCSSAAEDERSPRPSAEDDPRLPPRERSMRCPRSTRRSRRRISIHSMLELQQVNGSTTRRPQAAARVRRLGSLRRGDAMPLEPVLIQSLAAGSGP